MRRFLPRLVELVCQGRTNPEKIFDQTLPLGQVAEGYRGMDERRAIKVLLAPSTEREPKRGEFTMTPSKLQGALHASLGDFAPQAS